MAERGKSQLSLILDHYNFKNYINTIGREELLNSSVNNGVILNPGMGDIADSLFSVSHSPLFTKEFLAKFNRGDESKNIGKVLQVTFENIPGITKISDESLTTEEHDVRLLNLKKDSFRPSLRKANENDFGIECNIQGYDPKETSKTSLEKGFSLKDIIPNSNFNKKPNENPTKKNPHLATYQIFDEALAIGNRQTSEIAAFLNTIPTLEFSRAVPLIAAKFSLPSKIKKNASSSSRDFTVANNADFLFGSEVNSVKDSMNSFRGDMFEKTITNSEKQTASKTGITSNLDIFLSPQTMVNTEEKFSGADGDYTNVNKDAYGRANPVIDKMRPFMSISSFNIDVRPTRGLMSYKTAQLELVLHDRSRMADVAPFIKPDLFGSFGSEIILEYGWAHPDGANPYGAMLNLLRAKEKYMIVNSSFSLQQTGEVNISLSLAMLGATDIINRNVFSSELLQNQIKSYEDLIKDFSDTNSRSIQKAQSLTQDYKTLAQDIASNSPAGEAYKKILRKVAKLPSIANSRYDDLIKRRAAELLKTLEEIDKAKGTIFNDIKKSLSVEADPYISFDIMKKLDLVDKDGKVIDKSNTEKNKSIKDYTSFGKLVLAILSKELLSSERFNEIQVVFYNSNIKSSKAASVNLANLPIRKKFLNTFIEKVIQENLKQLSFGAFLQSISKRFIENKANILYGFKGIFVYDVDTGNTKVPKNITTSQAIANQKEILYKVYYGQEQYNLLKSGLKKESKWTVEERRAMTRKVDFLPIRVGFSSEVIYKSSESDRVKNYEVSPEPSFSFRTGNEESDTILKIHIYDKANTPFQGAYDFINTEVKLDLETINNEMIANRTDLNKRKAGDYARAFNKALYGNLRQLNAEAIDRSNPDTTDITIKTKFGSIKETYKKIMPSLTDGSQNSAIINASFQTINEGRLPTVFITRADREIETAQESRNGTTSVGAEDLPLRVLPTKVELTTLGCPIINFAQSLFFDFNTGTTIDNLYNVVGIKHTIASGKFESSMTLQYGDVYGKFESRIVSDLLLDKTIATIAKNARDDEKRRAEERRARRRDAAGSGRRKRTTNEPIIVINMYTF